MERDTAQQVLLRLQDELKSLQLQSGGVDDRSEIRIPPMSKGSGPRLFCGHVPKEATEDLVKAHFSRWGIVTDVYFPRHKKTLKRRPFCFVTFASKESAERALAESPLNICGVPIKNLTMVEDRDKYYKEKHAATQQALLSALSAMGAAGTMAPEHVNNIAALLAMEGINSDVLLTMLLQPSAAAAALHSFGVSGQKAHVDGGSGSDKHAMQLQQTNFSPPRTVYSAPQPQRSDLFGHPNYSNSNLTNALAPLRSSGPASTVPFGTMNSREGSLSSLSSLSDWYSNNSSNRTSLDLGGTGFFNPATTSQMPSGCRSSLEAAQLRQQLANSYGAGLSQQTAAQAISMRSLQQQQQQQHRGHMLQSSVINEPSPAFGSQTTSAVMPGGGGAAATGLSPQQQAAMASLSAPANIALPSITENILMTSSAFWNVPAAPQAYTNTYQGGSSDPAGATNTLVTPFFTSHPSRRQIPQTHQSKAAAAAAAMFQPQLPDSSSSDHDTSLSLSSRNPSEPLTDMHLGLASMSSQQQQQQQPGAVVGSEGSFWQGLEAADNVLDAFPASMKPSRSSA